MNDGSSTPIHDDLLARIGVGFAREDYDVDTRSRPEANSGSSWPNHLEMTSLYMKKKKEFLHSLLSALDTVLYIELSAIYYMDCFFFGFFLRAICQFTFLSPKPVSLPTPKHQPYTGALLGTNLLCIITHIYRSTPEAGEATRGYMHGSLLIDFVGQRGPSSKVHLLILDALIISGQLLTLAVFLEYHKLKNAEGKPGVGGASDQPATDTPVQDLDSEERGLLSMQREQGDLELQPLSPSGRAISMQEQYTQQGGPGAQEHLSGSTSNWDEAVNDLQSFDGRFSGEMILADFHVMDTLRNQFWAYQNRGTTV